MRCNLCRLYIFEGTLVKADGSRDALDIAVLLRHYTLRNTDWIIGQMLFAGLHTEHTDSMQRLVA